MTHAHKSASDCDNFRRVSPHTRAVLVFPLTPTAPRIGPHAVAHSPRTRPPVASSWLPPREHRRSSPDRGGSRARRYERPRTSEGARTRITRGVSANQEAHRRLFGLAFSSPVTTVSRRTSESPRSQRDRYRSSHSSGGIRTDRRCDAPRSRSHTAREGPLPSGRPWSHSGTRSAYGADPSRSSPVWTPFGPRSYTTTMMAAHENQPVGIRCWQATASSSTTDRPSPSAHA